MLDERSYLIINKIAERPFIEKQDLMKQTKLTQRQLDYSLEKINNWLLENIDKNIKMNHSQQLSLDYETKEWLIKEGSTSLSSNQYILNSEQRIIYMYFLLFIEKEYLSINHFIHILKVSRTTVNGDLKLLSEKLSKSAIALGYNRKQGYHLVGKEKDIRYLGLKLVLEEINGNNNHQLLDVFLQENALASFEETKEIILSYAKEHQIYFIENRLKEFIYTLLILIKRLRKDDNRLEDELRNHFFSIRTTKEYHFSQDILMYYGKYSEENVFYLCAWILGLTLGEKNESSTDYAVIMDLVDHIRMRFESFSGIRFDNPIEVSNQLYRHFRPVYYRMCFNLPIVNPLYEKIKHEYNNFFSIVYETLKPLGAVFNNNIPEEEIAYLTIHFASLASNNGEQKMKQKVGLIVCPNGVGSSSITYTVLQSIFPEFKFLLPIETSAIDEVKDSYDIVFSTVPDIRLFQTKKPVYIVSPVMNTAEKYRLIRDVYTELGNSVFKLPSVESITQIIEKHATIQDKNLLEKELYNYLVVNENIPLKKGGNPNLSEIIDPAFIQLQTTVKNWQEGIYYSAFPLLQKGRITEHYIEKMIENAKKDGPYMVIMPNVALPHARPAYGVNELSIGVTALKEPVYFDHTTEKPVKYIICLAAINQDLHLHALNQLVQLLENEEFFHLLDNETNPEKIYDYILQKEK